MSIYKKLGVEPIINASGAVTRLGGAPLPQAALEAFQAAAAETVPLEQIQAAASRHIAKVTGAESGLVTAGSAAALTLGTAAILAGFDLGRMESLPHCDNIPNEMIIAREQRSGYDHAVRAAGARLVEVGFNEIVANAGVRRTEAWEYQAAIGPNTAGLFYSFCADAQPSLAEVLNVAHSHNLPVLVDAAGELPPRDHLTCLIAAGADLVAFSGGKSIRGPQSTGILCGRRELIASAALQMLDMDDHPDLWDPPADFIDRSKFEGMPRHGLGRAMKVSKEEVVALLTSLDLFVSGAYDEDLIQQRKDISQIAEALVSTSAMCCILNADDPQRSPYLEITLPSDTSMSATEICRRLRDGSPSIYVSHGKLSQGVLVIYPLCLGPNDVDILCSRLAKEIS